MMKNNILVNAAIFGAIAVIFGAFGAHALKEILSAEHLVSFQTGVRYQIIHSVVLLFLFLIVDKYKSKHMVIASKLIFWGIILFSGSIYILTLKNILEIEILKFAGPITPIGGALIILGWIFIIIGGVKLKLKS
jgi:uncharacterized membrane protein YgdD (TMEM256/DUF423 family)